MSYTLVIVDMQENFDSVLGNVVRANCRREISKAINDNAAILVLEYHCSGETVRDIRSMVDGYRRCWTASKYMDDGSNKVEELVYAHRLAKAHIKVCGVNTDCCVRQTVRGLTSRFPRSKIDVIADACASSYDHVGGLRSLKKMSNVNVLTR
jgi:hypothetical protein